MTDVSIREAASAADIAAVKEIFTAYAHWLDTEFGMSLCYEDFDGEMAGFPGKYARPGGRMLVAETGGSVIGAVALRRYSQTACEIKRLYVPPQGQGKGAGAALVTAITEAARAAGYREVLLDTLQGMTAARRLYARAGFEMIGNYNNNPTAGVVHMRLDLDAID